MAQMFCEMCRQQFEAEAAKCPRCGETEYVLVYPAVGKQYRVRFDDCCVEGSFTGELVAVEGDPTFKLTWKFKDGSEIEGYPSKVKLEAVE